MNRTQLGVAAASLSRTPPRHDPYATWGLRIALALGIGEVVAQLVDFGVFDLRIEALDSSGDKGLFGLLSVVVLVASVLAAWLLALASRPHRVVDGVAAVALSLVLLVQIAEPPHRLAIVLPFGVAALTALWRLGTGLQRASRLIRTGCVVLVVSFVAHAFGARLVSHLGYTSDSWPYQIKSVVKHAGELCGWTLVTAGLMSTWNAGRLGRPQSGVRPPNSSTASERLDVG
jgi:hypothetical protein